MPRLDQQDLEALARDTCQDVLASRRIAPPLT